MVLWIDVLLVKLQFIFIEIVNAFLWVLCVRIVILWGCFFQRSVEPPEVHHERLFLVSLLGFIVNLVGIFAFQHGGGHHGHSHGGSHGHSHSTGHGHSHGSGHGHSHGVGHGKSELSVMFIRLMTIWMEIPTVDKRMILYLWFYFKMFWGKIFICARLKYAAGIFLCLLVFDNSRF